jgi:hypothetical protein
LECVPDQHDPFPSCAVCGRTILKGEQAHEYVNPQGQRLGVCVLCRSRAEASGWIPADRVGTATQAPPSRARRGDALRKRFERAASRARSSAAGRRDAPTGKEGVGAENHKTPEPPAKLTRAKPTQRAEPKRPPKRQPKRPPKRQPTREPPGEVAPRKPRRRRGPEALMRRAVERFNGSDERRKVAGLIRSLGEPRAAVRPDAGRQMALVTVAWELSWYQWEVSGDGQGEPVREVAKGDEVSELADDAQAWNAAVSEDGKLRLRSTSPRRKASGKQA